MITRRQVATLLWRALRKIDPTFAKDLRSDWRIRDLQKEAEELMRKAIAQMDAVSVTSAEARKQFAGSGATVNIYGVPTEDASARGNAEDWARRTVKRGRIARALRKQGFSWLVILGIIGRSR